jgi:DNA-binding NarL/FixJ family response regulator
MGKNSLDGLALIQRIKALNSQAHIVVLSMHDDPSIIACALLEAGASGYVTKDDTTEDLLNAIRTIQEGEFVFAPKGSAQREADRNGESELPIGHAGRKSGQRLGTLDQR